MADRDKLKPCPFCGAQPKDVARTGSIWYGSTYYVECKRCGVMTREYTKRTPAVTAWNRRKEPKDA